MSLSGQGASHPPRRSSTRCSIPSHANHWVGQLDLQPSSLKLFSLQWPRKTTVDTTRPHNFAHFLDSRHSIDTGATCCRWGTTGVRTRRPSVEQVSQASGSSTLGRLETGWGGLKKVGCWAAFWRASDGKWRFPMAQPSLVGQTRSHVPEVLVAWLRRFFFEEGTRCLLVAQMQVPFLPRACHLLLSEENSAKLQKTYPFPSLTRLVDLQRTSRASLSIPSDGTPSHQARQDERVTQLLATVTNPTNVGGTSHGDLRPSWLSHHQKMSPHLHGPKTSWGGFRAVALGQADALDEGVIPSHKPMPSSSQYLEGRACP